MVFAVDNTTEKIIKKLQEAIDDSIRKVHNNQKSLSEEIQSLKGEISQEEVLDSLRGVRNDFEEIGDKIGDLKRSNEDSLVVLDKIQNGVKKLESNPSKEDFQKIQDSLNDLSLNLLDLKDRIEIIQNNNESIGDNIGIIQKDVTEMKDTETYILNCEESLEKQVESILSAEKDFRKILDEIQNKTDLNGTRLEEMEEKVVTSSNRIKTEIQESITSSCSHVIEELKDTIEEQRSLTEQRLQDNREELLIIQKSIENSDKKIDKLASDNDKHQKHDDFETEKIDKIIEYLKKPGIVRFFSGLKGE